MGNSRHDLSIPKDYFMKDKAKLLYVSSATYGGDWISTPHTHYCSELFYVLDGVGQFQVEDRIFPVSANDLVIINPNVSHTELGFHANPLKYIVLGIENLELSVANEGENFCIVSFREIKETMNFYLKMMLREIETRAPGYEAVCQDLMEILIVLFGRQTNFKTILTPTNKKSSHLCESVRRYIDANCSEDISLDYEFYHSHIMPLECGNDYTAKIIPRDINIWISRLFLGDSDGFSILYYQDVDSLIYWANQAAYRWKLRGMCMWSLGQEDMRIWEWLPNQTE